MKILSVIGEVVAERERQDAKWGQQNHPDGTGDSRHLFREITRATYGSLSYLARAHTNRTAAQGTVTFADILLEEVFEALAEDDQARVRAELVQVAAVAVAWVEAIDRRTESRGTPLAEHTPYLAPTTAPKCAHCPHLNPCPPGLCEPTPLATPTPCKHTVSRYDEAGNRQCVLCQEPLPR